MDVKRELLVGVPVDSRDLPVGTTLKRLWMGDVYVVEVLLPLAPPPVNRPSKEYRRRSAIDRGWWRYEYNGRRYKTLSAIAREITGIPTISGNRFFGLRRSHKCTASFLRK